MIQTFNYHNVCGERDNPWIVREGEEETISFFVFDWTMVQIKLQGISLLFFGPPHQPWKIAKELRLAFPFPLPKPLKPAIAMGKHWDIFTIVIQFVLHRFLFTIRGYTQPIFLASGQ